MIEELKPLIEKHPGKDLRCIYEPAITAYRDARRATLALYPRVLDTLKTIKQQGSKIIMYTEPLEFYSTYRIKKLGLDGVIDAVYFPRDHELPAGMTPEQVRHYSSEHYKLQFTQIEHTEKGETKPNPKLLTHIIESAGGDKSTSTYVGDKVPKDVRMAQEAGVIDVYAQYGDTVGDPRYEQLRRVTHWKSDAVAAEKIVTAANAPPTYKLRESFGELLRIFEFAAFPTQDSDRNRSSDRMTV